MALLKISDRLAKLPLINRFIAKAQVITKDNYPVQIVAEFKDKNRKDNQDWRDALTSADDPTNPNWSALQDFYDYVIVDSHTHSLIELRKAATLSKRFMVVDAVTGEEQPEKTALLQTEWFYNFLSEILDARSRGYTVAQLVNPAMMKFDYIPRRNVAIQKNFVRLAVGDDKGIKLDEPAIAPYIITVTDNYQYGYMNDLIPLIMWKLNAMMSWAEATEKWGIPPIIATTNKSDGKSIKLLQDMLKNAGESLTTILPEGSNVMPMTNSEKVDPQKMFDGLIERCNTEISKRIIGGTMISDNGSSHSQSKVHQENFDEKIVESDSRKCEFVATGQLLPMMARFGYPFTETDKLVFDRSTKLTPKEKADIFEIVSKEYEVDEEWVKKNLQIPITGKKATSPFKQASNSLVAALGACGIQLPNYTTISCGHKHNIIATGLFDDTLLMDLADALMNNVWNSENTLVNEALKAIETSSILRKALFESWSDRIKIGYDAPDHRCLAAMEYNLMNFSLAKTKADVLTLNQLLIDKDKNNIRSFRDFKTLAEPYIKKTNKDYLQTEYSHAVAVGQNSSRYFQFKKEEDILTQYVQWQTVGDSHVRASHAAMNGKIFDLKEKGGLTILPPKDWGCRCELVQYLGKPPKDLLYTNAQGLQTLNIERGSKWDINRADAEQVFTANEMYVKESQIAAEVNDLSFKDFKLKPYNEIKSNYKNLRLDTTINKDNVADLFKADVANNRMGFEDYISRKITLSKKVFDAHTTASKYIAEGRHQLFPFVADVLNEPDEIYMFKRGKDNYQSNYIKFYNNKALVVNTRLGTNGLEINTWFEMKVEADVRKGLLIKNKKS